MLINSSTANINLKAEVPFITFPALSELPYIQHGFSTRLGGVSKGIYESMNLGSDSIIDGDTRENILTNFKRISDSIGIDSHSIVVSHQVHKTNIRRITIEDRGKGLYIPRDYEETDGLITDEPGITLVTKFADCVPLYFVDKKNKAIGLTHSGWRGTVCKIGLLTVEKMGECFGTKPEDITAVIGPSICSDCYEVGGEVAQAFYDAFSKSGYNMNKLLMKNNNSGYQLDLWEANREILIGSGVPKEQVHISGVCTSCNHDILFSHRRTGGKRGSLAAFLAIRMEINFEEKSTHY